MDSLEDDFTGNAQSLISVHCSLVEMYHQCNMYLYIRGPIFRDQSAEQELKVHAHIQMTKVDCE